MLFLKVFFGERIKVYLFVIIFAMILLVVSSNFQVKYIHIFYTYAQQVEKNPGFQDSYWTDKTVAAGNDSDKLEEREVGPGEGIATLAVVLVNKAQSDISAIKGFLHLPDGFEAVERGFNSRNGASPSNVTGLESSNNDTQSNSSSNNPANLSSLAVASYDSIVTPGNEFTLYFDIYITDNAKVGTYFSNLDLVYSKVLTAGDIVVNDISIAFRVPGKVILDVETINQYLSPSKENKLSIDIINKGSADANSALITLSNSDENTVENLASVTERSTADSIQQDNSTEKANSTITSTTSTSTTNENTDDNVSSSSPITTIGTQKYDVGVIAPGEIVSIHPAIYPATSAAGTLQNLDIQISYGNSLGNRETVNYNLGLMINAESKESNFNVYLLNNSDTSKYAYQKTLNYQKSYDKTITAGSIEDLMFGVQKLTTDADIQDLVISIQPSSESIEVLGPSRWSFDKMDANILPLNTTVFASDELIGKPVQLNFNLDYLLSGVAKSETLELGLYVDGKISIRAYDFEINLVGDEPNLVSNLLNEGNVDALFTTVQMIPPLRTNLTPSSGINNGNNNNISLVEEYPPVQYIGDLAENSPLPINIPLKIPNDTVTGDYPVSIEVSYQDNLRNDHSLIVNGTVNYAPPADTSPDNTGLLFGFINPIMLMVIILVIGIIAYLVVKRIQKKKRSQRTGSSKDETVSSETDLDSILRDKD
jgi:hypothetical protein